MATFDSAPANVEGTVTRYVIKIDHYWSRKEQLLTGQCIESAPFMVGDCSWHISYFPNGACSSCTDYISIFLALNNEVAEPVKARARFSLLDQAGNPVQGHSVYTDAREYYVVGAGYGCDLFINKEFLEASEYLVDDCFRISCDVAVDRTTPPCHLQQHLGDHLMVADVTFQVGNETFSAHRCVLAARSPVFKAELFSAAREGTTVGDCIRIDGVLPQVFKALLHFVYTDSLPEMTEQEEFMMAEHLLVAADRYDLQGLKLICEEILSEDINEITVAKMLRLAVQHRCHVLGEACIEFLEHPSALEAAMATDVGLFDYVVKNCPELLELWADWFEDDSMQDELDMCL